MANALHNAIDTLIAEKAELLDTSQLHLYPYYGDVYAEVVNLAAGLDFNFVFGWGPQLQPHERIVIEVLVYLAREQARQTAFQAALRGERQEVPVEIYLETLPARFQAQGNSPTALMPRTLTQLTNLKRDRIYDALKSEQVAHFVQQESPGRRIHFEGRVLTPPTRFRVRVDPVPTQAQNAQIRQRLAERLLEDEIRHSKHTSVPLTSTTATTATSLMSLFPTSVISTTAISLMSEIATPPPSNVTSEKPLMSEIATSDLDGARCRSQRHDSETLQNPTIRNVSVTAAGGTETVADMHYLLEEWRRHTEELARHSASELGDKNSVGYHICVWNHARKHDKAAGEASVLTDGVFAILRELAERYQATHQPQGKAWTRRTRSLFEQYGLPLAVKSISAVDEAELAEVRAILAKAPFQTGNLPSVSPGQTLPKEPGAGSIRNPADVSQQLRLESAYLTLPQSGRAELDAAALREIAKESAFLADAVRSGKAKAIVEKRLQEKRLEMLAQGWRP